MIYHQSNAFLQDRLNPSHHLKTKEEVFSLNLAPFSSRFMVLAFCHPLIIVFDCENSFHLSGACHELFPFLSSEGHHFIILHSQCVAIFLQFFAVNCAFATFIFNSYSGSFKSSIPWLSYKFIHSFQILSVVHGKPSQVALYLS